MDKEQLNTIILIYCIRKQLTKKYQIEVGSTGGESMRNQPLAISRINAETFLFRITGWKYLLVPVLLIRMRNRNVSLSKRGQLAFGVM